MSEAEVTQPNAVPYPNGITIPISPKVLGSVLGLLLTASGGGIAYDQLTDPRAPPAVLEKIQEVKIEQVGVRGDIKNLRDQLTAATALNTKAYERLSAKLEKLSDRVLVLERDR